MAEPATSTAAQASASSQPAAPAAEASATVQTPGETPPGSETTTAAGAETAPDVPAGAGLAAEVPAGAEPPDAKPRTPGFGERGRMRRRVRFLRKARELAYRDLGGLVFEMHRLGERHDELASAKLATLSAIDSELRALEGALADRQPVTVLREAGIAACPRCAAIHGSEDRFCPACGTPMGRRAERPIATAGAPVAPTPTSDGTGTPAGSSAPAGSSHPTPSSAPTPSSPPTGSSAPTPSSPPTGSSAPTGPTAPMGPAAPHPSQPTPPATPPVPAAQPAKPPVPAAQPAPAPARPSGPVPPPAAKPTDDRPTEIIRPSDTEASGGA